MKHLVLFLTISTCLTYTTSAQEKFNLAAGLGNAEYYFISARYQLKQSQVGFNFSMRPDSHPTLGAQTRFIIGLSYAKHLFGHSGLSERKPWFIKSGIVYKTFRSSYIKTHDLYATCYVGRDFNFTKRLGVAVALGPVFRFYTAEEKGPYVISPGQENHKFLPGLEVSLFYRFMKR